MKPEACVAVAIVLLLLGSSVVAHASWTARLRVIPEGLGLEVGLLYEGEDRPMGRLLDLQFEIRNVSDELMKIDWDESSLQLPGTQRWHVVRPEALLEADDGLMSVPAGAGKTLRVCPSRSAVCDATWMHEARLNEDFSLTLHLSVSSPEGPRTAECRWDFDYEEDEQPKPNHTEYVAILTLALAAVATALLVLLLVL